MKEILHLLLVTGPQVGRKKEIRFLLDGKVKRIPQSKRKPVIHIFKGTRITRI
jgi:hypothetical protein